MFELKQTMVIKQNCLEGQIPCETSIYVYRDEKTKDIELVIKEYNENGIIDHSVVYEILTNLNQKAKMEHFNIRIKVIDSEYDIWMHTAGYIFDSEEEKDGHKITDYIFERRFD